MEWDLRKYLLNVKFIFKLMVGIEVVVEFGLWDAIVIGILVIRDKVVSIRVKLIVKFVSERRLVVG